MDENHEGKDPENEVPQKHPIVEHINQSERWLEEFNKRPLMERLEWILEPGTMNISRRVEQIAKDAISEINRLTDAIHQKDNAFEVCEERRWEAEEKVGELMDEIERLKAPPKKITNLDVQREIDRNSNGTDIYGDSF